MQRIVNYLVAGVGILIYLLLMFFFDLNPGSAKELNYVYFLAIPCFMFLFYSFHIVEKSERKKILYLYLVIYLTVLFGFVFSNDRTTWVTTEGILHYENNFIPLKSIFEMINGDLGIGFALYNIIGNFLMLTPLAILLPLISKNFTKKKVFLFTTCILTLLIECGQVLLNIGSFDIDDFLLNVGGAFLFCLFVQKKLHAKIEFLFLEFQLKKYICHIVYFLLLIIFILVASFYTSRMIVDINSRKVDISQLSCVNTEETYIVDYNNYHYYSACDYGIGKIKIGPTELLSIKDFIKRGALTNQYEQKLNLRKEPIITNIAVNEKEEANKRLVNSTEYSNLYFYHIESMIVTQDGIDYNLEEYFKDKKLQERLTIDMSPFLKLTYMHPKQEYVINTGKYYNLLSCTVGKKYDQTSNLYYLPVHYKITERSCDELESMT